MTLNIFCSLFKCRKIFNAFEANILFGYFQKNNKKDFNLPYFKCYKNGRL